MKKKSFKKLIKSIKKFRSYNNTTYLCFIYDMVDGRLCYTGKKPRTCKTCNISYQARILQNCVRNWM